MIQKSKKVLRILKMGSNEIKAYYKPLLAFGMMTATVVNFPVKKVIPKPSKYLGKNQLLYTNHLELGNLKLCMILITLEI